MAPNCRFNKEHGAKITLKSKGENKKITPISEPWLFTLFLTSYHTPYCFSPPPSCHSNASTSVMTTLLVVQAICAALRNLIVQLLNTQPASYLNVPMTVLGRPDVRSSHTIMLSCFEQVKCFTI